MYASLPSEVFRSRRDALIHRMPDRSAALFVSSPAAQRNADVVYPYRPDSDLWYLTGFGEPDCALLLTRDCDAPASVLFLRDRDPGQELWTGTRMGVDDAPQRLGVDRALPIDELEKRLPDLIRRAETLIHAPTRDPLRAVAIARALAAVRGGPRGPYKGPTAVADPTLTLHELRMIKGPEEVERLREANRITSGALKRAIAGSSPGYGEWQIQASLEADFRAGGGWGWSYPTIVASGPRACVLHYDANTAVCGHDEVVLVDAGAEVDGYAADVSRTFPVSPCFTLPQRDLYEAVEAAQQAAMDVVAPGITLDDVHDRAVGVLAAALVDLGLLAGPAELVVAEQTYKRYYPHQTSHWLGLDVHDVGRYYLDGTPRRLAPGMVFTVEPGLYVPSQDEDAPASFRGIGIRIEDDVLVTEDGYENLGVGIPRTIEDIEELKG